VSVAIQLGDAGRRAEALTASREAVQFFRELVETNRDTHLPNLAQSVNNLAVDLSEVRRRAEALAAAEEVSVHYHDLAQTEPDVFGEAASRADEFVATLSKDTP
jgi:hypothetical protein